MQDKIGAAAKEMGQEPDVQFSDLKDAQKQWLAYRDSNCTLEDSLAFGGTAIGGNYWSCLCALSYQRINDFERIEKAVWAWSKTPTKARFGPSNRLKPAKKPVYYASNS